MNIVELYNANGEKASLSDVCKWWLEKYPEYIFKNAPQPIVSIREEMKKILGMLGERKDEL